MIDALLLALAILIIGALIWLGDAVAGGIESALGEKPLRERWRQFARGGSDTHAVEQRKATEVTCEMASAQEARK